MSDYYSQVEQRITAAVTALINDPSNEEKLYELLMCGHVAYKGGLGLPHKAVHDAIREGVVKALEVKIEALTIFKNN